MFCEEDGTLLKADNYSDVSGLWEFSRTIMRYRLWFFSDLR